MWGDLLIAGLLVGFFSLGSTPLAEHNAKKPHYKHNSKEPNKISYE